MFDASGRVLLARRHSEAHQGGLWEFPGGKVEAHESAYAGLQRELREELGVELRDARPLIRVRHRYPDRAVLLDIWRVEAFDGQARGCEGQQIEWVEPARLGAYAMPAADVPIINAVRLPTQYLITGAAPEQTETFLQRLRAALERGIRLVQLRAKSLPENDFVALGQRVASLCHDHGAQLLVNADPRLVTPIGADGVHLSSQTLASLPGRPLDSSQWVAASCHSEQELLLAERIGADFVLASPVLPTSSHPDAPPLGWDGLRRLTEVATVPVYALGGMRPEHLSQSFDHGAQGIAAIRSLWLPDGNEH